VPGLSTLVFLFFVSTCLLGWNGEGVWVPKVGGSLIWSGLVGGLGCYLYMPLRLNHENKAFNMILRALETMKSRILLRDVELCVTLAELFRYARFVDYQDQESGCRQC
jgi:hypothetical protein